MHESPISQATVAEGRAASVSPAALPGTYEVCCPPSWQAPSLAAAFAVLLHRMTAQDEVPLVIRTGELSDKSHPFEIHFDLSENPTFGRVAQLALTAFDRTGAPGTSVCISPETLGRELMRDARRVLEDNSCGLELVVTDKRVFLTGPVPEFDAQLLASTADALSRITLVGLEAPETRTSQLPLLSDSDRDHHFKSWSDSRRDCAEASIPELFEQQVDRRGQAIALWGDEEALTFRQVNDRANRLAHFLRRLGIQPGQFVGISMESCASSVVAAIAILKAGAVYVPLYPGYPTQRLAELIEDAKPGVIVTSAACAGRLPDTVARVLNVDVEAARIAAESTHNLEGCAGPDSPAYVLYTSGSTGEPLGVVGIHRSVVNAIPEALFDPDRQGEVCCLNTPLSVGFSILPTFLPLMLGVPTVVLSDAQMKDPMAMADIVSRYGVTTMGVSTPVLRQLVAVAGRLGTKLHTVRVIMTGGSQLTSDLIENLARAFPWIQLQNGYGSSEVGSIATKGPAVSATRITVGRPIVNTQIYLLDQYQQPVLRGGVGEIYVSARHLALEYLNHPEITNQRFLPDAFRDEPNARMFKTGDLGRLCSGGELELLGRADDQVKVRGFRLHLSEVENALSGHPCVGEAAVAVREFHNEPRLIAYIVPRYPLQSVEIRDYLRKRLPQYMVPTAFVFLEELPLTAAGKVHRAALPMLALKGDGDFEEATIPIRKDVETVLTEIWREVLGVQSIGLDNHFLDLGGDSLFAAQVTGKVWDYFECDLSIEEFFDHATIRALASLIRSREK